MKKAFIIGANKKNLKYSKKDAFKIAAAFLDEGFVVAGKEVTAFKAIDFYFAFKEFVDDLKESDQIVFYFVGHSFLGNNNMLYLAIESSDINDYKTCISAAEITHIIQQCRAKNKLIVLDSCHSSALVATANFDIRKVNYTIISASEPWLEVAELDNKDIKGGFLSHFFWKALKGQEEALDEKKELTANSLEKWIDKINEDYQNLNIPKVKVDKQLSSSFTLTSFTELKKSKGNIQVLNPISLRIDKAIKKSSLADKIRGEIFKMQLQNLLVEQQHLMEEFNLYSLDKQLAIDKVTKLHYQRNIDAKLLDISELINKVQKIETQLEQLG